MKTGLSLSSKTLDSLKYIDRLEAIAQDYNSIMLMESVIPRCNKIIKVGIPDTTGIGFEDRNYALVYLDNNGKIIHSKEYSVTELDTKKKINVQFPSVGLFFAPRMLKSLNDIDTIEKIIQDYHKIMEMHPKDLTPGAINRVVQIDNENSLGEKSLGYAVCDYNGNQLVDWKQYSLEDLN